MPFHSEAASSWTLNSWDRTQIPKPFTTVAMAIAEPLYVPRDADDAALEEWRQQACSSRSPNAKAAMCSELLMPLVLVSSKRFVDHVTPVGHPERPERAQALTAVADVVQGAGRRGGRASRGDRRGSAARAHAGTRRCDRRDARQGDDDRRGHVHVAGLGRDRAAGRGRGADRRRSRARWSEGIARARAGAAAGASRRSRSRDGLLSLQQRRRRRRLRAIARLRARGDRRLRRASRQRHAVDLLRGSDGAVRLVAPVSVLSRHRRGVARREGAPGSASRSTSRSMPARKTTRSSGSMREQVDPRRAQPSSRIC